MGFNADNQASPFLVYTSRIKYIWESGISLLPVAATPAGGIGGAGGPGQTSARPAAEVCQVAAPYGFKVVQFTAIRSGKVPLIPHPDPQDSNQVLKRAEIIVSDPKLQADGVTYTTEVHGTYVYAMLVPVWMLDAIKTGQSPYDDGYGGTGGQYNLSATNFVSGLQ